jgi:transposase-like protein
VRIPAKLNIDSGNRRSIWVGIRNLSEALGIGYSTLQKWIKQSQEQAFDIQPEPINTRAMMREKRPQAWSQEEKLSIVFECAALSEEEVRKLCCEQDVYPY